MVGVREQFDAIVVGAGFAGMYMLHRLRGLGLSVRVYEAGSGVGGTWFWNRYPGARCDVDSMEYSYQFSEELQQEWEWTERYATQAEILRYAEHVADRFDLLRDIVFETRVEAATWDEEASRWRLRTSAGDQVGATFYIMATGCLSSTNTPAFPGLERFEGDVYHTGRWPHEGVDFTGRTVGVIGTGSSAIQSIPLIAEQALELTVFQRTPNYSIPAHNAPLDPDDVREIKANYAGFRAANWTMPAGFGSRHPGHEESALALGAGERHARYEERWQRGGLQFLGAFGDLGLNREANETAADFIRGKIREIVDDPEVAELLAPDQVVGCKRLCVDTGYYATFNRKNVSLVDVRKSPIEEITATGLRTGDAAYEFDALVLATGFDAMTGALLAVDIRVRGGLPLCEKWAAGPRMLLGLCTAGFPNFFTITGPGSPSVLSNMLPTIEQHVNWIADCIAAIRAGGHRTIEAEVEAEDAWVEHVNAVADLTLYKSCNSWYLGANVPGKPRIFMPLLGVPDYVARCKEIAATGYPGFVLAGGG